MTTKTPQTQITEQLQAYPAIKSLGIPIVAHEAANLAATITEALAKNKGLCLIVSTPSFDCSNANLPEPCFDGLTAIVTCFEYVMFNRSASGANVNALNLIFHAAAALWHFQPSGWPKLYLRKKNAITPVTDKKLSGYNLHLVGGAK